MERTKKSIFEKIQKIQIETSHWVEDLLTGAYLSAFKGRGMEFEEVREYIPGDEVRYIDWNVTARSQHPYIKVFREERQLTLILVIDVSSSTLFGSHYGSKNERIAEIAAIFGFSAIKNHDRVGLVLFSDHVEKYISPKRGTRHVVRLIRDVLAYQPKSKGTDLSVPLDFLGNIQRKKGVCIMISDYLGKLPEHKVALAAKRFDLIGIQVYDPTEENFPDMGLVRLRDLELDREALIDTSSKEVREELQQFSKNHRTQMQRTFNKVGAGYLELPLNTSPIFTLRQFFRRRARQGA